ncbi:Rho guanine nucleotide exchange factor scd1 [Fusarium bulbicola]|nr:Rho guanine nucleotide exchange factor scd1 [Fusarium bulbicola]
MDPLSVIASVAGIATAAGEVIKILGPYTTAREDAPKIAAEVSSEALATQTIVTGLEQLISNFSAANVRLQAFKSSIICILSILQSESQARAEESQQQLIAAVDTLLRGNTALSRRMMGMENTMDAMSYRRATIQSTREIGAQERKSTSSRRPSLFEFDFEHDLKLSRVYRLAKRDTMDFSARSSVARTHAWSSLSGTSLSDISHISVLALPLYAEDISNPQHYNFGKEAVEPTDLLAPTLLTRSIYHDCIEVQLQLSQLEWFAEFHQTESFKDENPLSNLISIFRLGTPLLMLFNELDSSHRERWKDLITSSPSDEVSKLAITELVEACMKCSDIPASNCITDTEILHDDTTCHVKKVINLVRFLLARLAKAGMIQPIVFEPAPNIFAVEPNPAGLAVDAFLCDERLYLQHLESLFENAKKIRSSRIFSTDSSGPLFAPVGPLVNVQ